MHQEIENYGSSCQCCYLKIHNRENAVEFSQEIANEIQEITKLNLNEFKPSSGLVCSRCNFKLNEFKTFKSEIIDAHFNFKALKGYSVLKLEDFETSSSTVVQEISEIVKKEENFVVLNQCFLPSLKLEEVVETKQKKTPKLENTTIKRRQRRKDAPKLEDHFCPYRHCNKYFTESRKVKLHVERIHKGQKNFNCDLCPYTAFKKYEMLLHLSNIHKSKEFLLKTATCPTCGLSFSSNSRLTVHMKRKHLQHIVRRRACDLCGIRFEALNEIRKHVVIHLPKDLKEFVSCEICGARFYSKGSLKVHHDNKHSEKPSIKCFCGKEFRQKSVFSRHGQVVHAGLKPHKCKFCQKEFSGKNHLDYHVKAFHTAITMIPCEICGQKYKNEDTLKKHIIYHSDPKFGCSLCDAKFHENKKLLDHMSVHKKLQFACECCTRSFRLESQLRAHLKKVHFKEKLTFKCEICSSTFTRKSTYRDHALRQHKELNIEEMTQFLERIKKSLAVEHQK